MRAPAELPCGLLELPVHVVFSAVRRRTDRVAATGIPPLPRRLAKREQDFMSEVPSATWTERIESVYREQSRELWALFYAHCGESERAYDAVQESFLRLQQQPAESVSDLRAWLLQVGRNWLRDQSRRKGSRAAGFDGLDTADCDRSPLQSLIQEEHAVRVRHALRELAEEDRQVLVLRYALAWSSQRISDAVGSTPAAVDMRLSRARKRLAQELFKLGIHHESI